MKIKLFLALTCFSIFTLSVFAQVKVAEKITEFEEVSCEEYLAIMDTTINQANHYPSARIYVFVYEGRMHNYKYKKDGSYTIGSVFPPYGLANAKIRSMKKLLQYRSGAPERYIFIKGGFRENFTVELWLVPDGASVPEPTPTLTKLKYRKGKPEEFCLSCCES